MKELQTQMYAGAAPSPLTREPAGTPAREEAGEFPRFDRSDEPAAGFAFPDGVVEPSDALCTTPPQILEGSPMLDDLAEQIGEDAALKLVEAYGGRRVYIPHQPIANDVLTSSIGLAAAIRLSQIYGGDRLEVPNPTPRKVRVLELRSNGLSVDAIARKLGCTRRRVFQVLANARAGRRINADRTPGS